MTSTLIAGLLTGLSLIVAIGAQNAFVLRQGLAREHVGLVVAICALSDLLLIALGVAGVGELVARHPGLLLALRWIGAAYLVWFAVQSWRSARRPQGLSASGATAGRGAIAVTALSLTYLNPHVYLDTVLMLGNLANQHGSPGRWWYAAGAGLGSVCWFSGLGFGATKAARWFVKPLTWRVLDILIGFTMLGIALVLVLS